MERLEASLARQAAAAAAVAAAASVNTPHTKLTAQPALVVSAPKMEVTLSPADFVKQELLRQRYENVGVCTSRGGDVATLGLSASVTSSGSGSGRGGIKHTTRTLPAPCRSSPSPPLPPSPTGLENEGGGFGAPDLLLSDYLWGGGDGGGSSAAGSSVSPPLTAVPLTTGTARTTRATAAGATADPPSLSHYLWGGARSPPVATVSNNEGAGGGSSTTDAGNNESRGYDVDNKMARFNDSGDGGGGGSDIGDGGGNGVGGGGGDGVSDALASKVTTASKDYPAITRMLEAAGEYPPSLQDGDGGPVSRSVECSSSLTDDGRCSKSRSSSDSNYGDTASNDDEEAGAAKSSSVRRIPQPSPRRRTALDKQKRWSASSSLSPFSYPSPSLSSPPLLLPFGSPQQGVQRSGSSGRLSATRRSLLPVLSTRIRDWSSRSSPIKSDGDGDGHGDGGGNFDGSSSAAPFPNPDGGMDGPGKRDGNDGRRNAAADGAVVGKGGEANPASHPGPIVTATTVLQLKPLASAWTPPSSAPSSPARPAANRLPLGLDRESKAEEEDGVSECSPTTPLPPTPATADIIRMDEYEFRFSPPSVEGADEEFAKTEALAEAEAAAESAADAVAAAAAAAAAAALASKQRNVLLAAHRGNATEVIRLHAELMAAHHSSNGAAANADFSSAAYNATDAAGALWVAAQSGHATVVNTLLDHCRVKVDVPHGALGTALLVAAQNGHLPVVEALLARDADVEIPDPDGVTPLFMAAKNKRLGCVQLLAAAGANVDAPRWSVTPRTHPLRFFVL